MFPENFYQWLTWVVTGFGIYVWKKVDDIEKRTQRLEDRGDEKMESLTRRVEQIEGRIETVEQRLSEIEKTLVEIKTNLHSHKNQENILNATLSAILKHLERESAS